MTVIGEDALNEFKRRHPNSEGPLETWKKIMEKSSFRHFPNLKETFGSADYDKPFTFFDIGGNKYRIVAQVNYGSRVVNVRHVFTHPEYDAWNKRREA